MDTEIRQGDETVDEFWRLSATDVTGLARRGEVTPGEVLENVIARVEAVNPAINALPTFCFGRARAAAERLRTRSRSFEVRSMACPSL